MDVPAPPGAPGQAAGGESVEVPVDERGHAGRQVIPRPPGAAPGRPAPWASLPAERRRGIRLTPLRAALELHSRALQATDWVAFEAVPDPGAPSAVLVPLFEEAGEARVVLTRRAAHLRTHTGEVSFPGGRLDPGESPEEGARREAAEEVGLDPTTVDVVGRLTPLETFSSRSAITPVVAMLPARPRLAPNPNEVELVFDVSLARLASDGVFSEERWVLPGSVRSRSARHVQADDDGAFPMWFFELDDDTVWGATARILVELLRLALGS